MDKRKYIIDHDFMPRKLRDFQVGGVYHIVKRGVEKRPIFHKAQDYSRFILSLEFFNNQDYFDFWSVLERTAIGGTVPPMAMVVKERLGREREVSKKQIVDVFAFALMPNHFHLILREIQKGGISLFMRKLGGYAMYFNKQYDRTGPLFESRYKAVPLADEPQLKMGFVYVHTNPVELEERNWKQFRVQNPARAMEKLREYRWSSYRDYIGIPNVSHAIQQEFYTNLYGGAKECEHAVKSWISQKHDEQELISPILLD